MRPLWKGLDIDPRQVAKIAVGPKHGRSRFDPWEAILSEIITGDAFGVDRMDYLLRDSHHIGVTYGKFDHHCLIDNLRVLPNTPEGSDEPTLGLYEVGLGAAEQLLFARYFFYTQVCFHPIRRIYDIHLREFLKEWYGEGKFPIDIKKFLSITDNEILANLHESSSDEKAKGYDPARRIVNREHFRFLYKRNCLQRVDEVTERIFSACCERFKDHDPEKVFRRDRLKESLTMLAFPVLKKDGSIKASVNESEILQEPHDFQRRFIFIAPELSQEAKRWREENLSRLETLETEEEET